MIHNSIPPFLTALSHLGSNFIQGLIEKRGRGVVPDALLAQATKNLDRETSNSALADRIYSVLELAQVSA